MRSPLHYHCFTTDWLISFCRSLTIVCIHMHFFEHSILPRCIVTALQPRRLFLVFSLRYANVVQFTTNHYTVLQIHLTTLLTIHNIHSSQPLLTLSMNYRYQYRFSTAFHSKILTFNRCQVMDWMYPHSGCLAARQLDLADFPPRALFQPHCGRHGAFCCVACREPTSTFSQSQKLSI